LHQVDPPPRIGAGVSTIWHDDGNLVYVGIAGSNRAGKAARAAKETLPGRRSGDQFCVRSEGLR
jgi:hypothetical protein